MQEATTALQGTPRDVPPVRGDETVAETKDAVGQVLAQLVNHRRRGADLLWEAYSLDTGGGE